MYMYIYIYICICVYIFIDVYGCTHVCIHSYPASCQADYLPDRRPPAIAR